MTVRFSETQYTVAEDAGSITVTVEMIGESDIPIEVNVSTSPISATSKLCVVVFVTVTELVYISLLQLFRIHEEKRAIKAGDETGDDASILFYYHVLLYDVLL